jgi:hypothetical protein
MRTVLDIEIDLMRSRLDQTDRADWGIMGAEPLIERQSGPTSTSEPGHQCRIFKIRISRDQSGATCLRKTEALRPLFQLCGGRDSESQP